jgi:hypothetical protein
LPKLKLGLLTDSTAALEGMADELGEEVDELEEPDDADAAAWRPVVPQPPRANVAISALTRASMESLVAQFDSVAIKMNTFGGIRRHGNCQVFPV